MRYAWGEDSPYVVAEFLPERAARLGIAGAVITSASRPPEFDRWRIPRPVCGTDWRSPEGFAALIDRYLAPGDPTPSLRRP